ncbi:KDP operon transcriptional regulatory protein kdpE [Nostocoides japonicum T1-X7]|uniref:KDP operon transcriptional regulatory protein kdpE n=1 Tax=Nostocoides japonicum T1-X7 TaxID=1194083 RepID=A0A077LZP6_9MICO|nr:KDP operon transcriptional regulatory protein kdpE [Tetrasphaera japonica T1-X7]
MTTVLVVDDDPHLRRTLAISLRAHGYTAEAVGDGRSALQSVAEEPPDVVVLDLGLPDIDGVEVLRRIREGSGVPVIVLSARTDSVDKVEALDLGADDYVGKPFGMPELLARVRVALRHAEVGAEGGPATKTLVTRHFVLDFADRRAVVAGRPVRLTPTEWRFLETLARADGHLVPREELLRQVWGPAYHSESNYLRVYANQLRRKLEPEPGAPRYLVTDPGQGYRLLGDPDS